MRGFPALLPGTAGTLAVWGGAGSDGRYVGRLQWSPIWRPLRWLFVLQPDPAAGMLAVFCSARSDGQYVGRFVVEADPATGTLMAPIRVEKGGRHKRQI